MTTHTLSPLRLSLIIAALFICWIPISAQAAWWTFGAKDDIPEIFDLKFNQVSLEQADGEVVLGRDMLENGRIAIRGSAEVGEGKIGKVEVSFDGGQNWKPTKLGKNGLFILEGFTPQFDQEYNFKIRALTTTGKSSPVEDMAFTFKVLARDDSQVVRQAFLDLIKLYSMENRAGFLALVSPDFEGNISELEDAIEDDFRYFDNIRIEPNIVRIVRFNGHYEVYFTFNRQLQSTRSGQLLKDSAASTATFARVGDKFMLYEMAAPLIFGVSNPEELATNVTEEAVGQTVIVVSDTGDVATTTQSDEVEPARAETEDGFATLLTDGDLGGGPTTYQGFNFADNDVVDSSFGPDFYVETNIIFPGPGVQFQYLGTGNIDTVTNVPDTGYTSMTPILAPGQLIAFKLNDSTYAVIEITSWSDLGSNDFRTSFEYKYQPDGSTNM